MIDEVVPWRLSAHWFFIIRLILFAIRACFAASQMSYLCFNLVDVGMLLKVNKKNSGFRVTRPASPAAETGTHSLDRVVNESFGAYDWWRWAWTVRNSKMTNGIPFIGVVPLEKDRQGPLPRCNVKTYTRQNQINIVDAFMWALPRRTDPLIVPLTTQLPNLREIICAIFCSTLLLRCGFCWCSAAATEMEIGKVSYVRLAPRVKTQHHDGSRSQCLVTVRKHGLHKLQLQRRGMQTGRIFSLMIFTTAFIIIPLPVPLLSGHPSPRPAPPGPRTVSRHVEKISSPRQKLLAKNSSLN